MNGVELRDATRITWHASRRVIVTLGVELKIDLQLCGWIWMTNPMMRAYR